MEAILITFVAAVALGIAGQIIAERFQLPAILPLLIFGIVFGPAGLGFVRPEALGDDQLGNLELLTVLVSDRRAYEMSSPAEAAANAAGDVGEQGDQGVPGEVGPTAGEASTPIRG